MLSIPDIRRFDWILFLCCLALAAVGIAFIHSATYGSRMAREEMGRPVRLMALQSSRQFVWAVLGVCVCAVAAAMDYEFWRKWAYTFYALGLVALILVMGFGVTRGGSRRWFLAPGGVLIQPSEIVKVFFILAAACYLMYRKNYRTLRGLFAPFLFALAPMVLIMRQPDLGTSLVFPPVMFAMLYAAGAKPKHLLAVLGAGLACAPGIWFFVMSARQKGRILAFIYPHMDPSGAGYHLLESLIAIGSGGWTGHGYARGPQNLLSKVPEAQTDFVFSVVAEEWGFAGGALVILLYAGVFWRIFEIAVRTREPFGRLVVVGCGTLLAFQALVNLGMTMRLCPITGLTLPFMSYGGSSLLTNFLILGLILGIGMRPKYVTAPDDFSVRQNEPA